MKSFLLVLASIGLTALCWGVYGPLVNFGVGGMNHSHLLPFVCVGIAYFVIAVVVPVGLLTTRGETGGWTATGTVWSLAAGAAGAIGALGIILARKYGGSPVYIMPLVFGGAPVVNAFLTMFLSKTQGRVNPAFAAGLILVVAGASMVLVFKPAAKTTPPATAETTPAASTPGTEQVPTTASTTALSPAAGHHGGEVNAVLVALFIALTALAWGVYGPVLHKGQSAMKGSRMRPFVCVGLAYFLIAVIVPVLLVSAGQDDWTNFKPVGAMWSLGAGTAGAIGAIGIILAFNFGGKPVYVMPLVFGGAPVINTFASMLTTNLESPSPWFYAGLIVVAAGAVTVLIFAPKPAHKPAPQPTAKTQTAGAHS